MNWLQRLLASFRGELPPDLLTAVQPRVTPDPQDAAALERQFSELAYVPADGFHRDQRAERSNVIPLRRRAR